MILIIIALLIEIFIKPRLEFTRHYVLLWYGTENSTKKRDYIILKKKI